MRSVHRYISLCGLFGAWSTISLTVFTQTIFAQTVPSIVQEPNSSTVVQINGSQYNINGGSRAGGNVFHSFQKFGLMQGEAASFILPNDGQIQNVFARVMGGSPSFINGKMNLAGNASANVYFMNPAGIVFGANANINLPAAFTATTASGIEFQNGWFSAFGSNDYSRLLGEPLQLGFTMLQPGAIINAGELKASQAVRLTGGTVINLGNILTDKLLITSVPGFSTIKLQLPDSPLSFEFPVTFTDNGKILNSFGGEFASSSIADLIMGGKVDIATGIILDENGKVYLSSNNANIQNGDIVINQNFIPESQIQKSTSTLVSSVGNVQFSNYTGKLLRVKAGGSISGGNISINNNLTDDENDNPYYSSSKALTTPPENALTVFLQAGETVSPNTNINDYTYRSYPLTDTLPDTLRNTFTSTASRPASISVGDVSVGMGNSIVMLSKNSVKAGHIRTGGDIVDRSNYTTALPGSVHLYSHGKITVKTIDTSTVGNGSDYGGDVWIESGGAFQATDILFRGGSTRYTSSASEILGKNVTVSPMPSIRSSGTSGGSVYIKHGGNSFTVGPQYLTNEKGEVLYTGVITESNGQDKEVPVKLISSNGERIYSTEDGRQVDADKVKVSASLVSLNDPNASFTAGSIGFNVPNQNAVISIQDVQFIDDISTEASSSLQIKFFPPNRRSSLVPPENPINPSNTPNGSKSTARNDFTRQPIISNQNSTMVDDHEKNRCLQKSTTIASHLSVRGNRTNGLQDSCSLTDESSEILKILDIKSPAQLPSKTRPRSIDPPRPESFPVEAIR
jgi:filamentous hemagglutinin family protein